MSEKKKKTKLKEKNSAETILTKKPKSPKASREVSNSSDHEGENMPTREPNIDFEAGVIFNRFDKNGKGVINADDFRKIWREAKYINSTNNILKQKQNESSSSSSSSLSNNLSNIVHDAGGALSFEAGQIFARFDRDGDGKLDKRDFEDVMCHYPNIAAVTKSKSSNLMSQQQQLQQSQEINDPSAYVSAATQLRPSYPPTSSSSSYNTNTNHNGNDNQHSDDKTIKNTNSNNIHHMLPMEIITGRLLTHYDETAGVAIPSTSVEHHRSMGNTVAPLVESYRLRYERLRAMLTGRLLPRREHIIQLRRQLDNCSIDVQAARRAIEKETMADAEQIIERLRSAESLRQSAIKQQILQLEVELESIERTIRKVELANEQSAQMDGSNGIIVTSVTSAIPGTLSSSSLAANGVESVKGHRAASMVELIQQFADISSTIERLSTKALTIQIDFPTTDFPKETSERLDKIARYEKCIHALQIKDQMIWTIIKEKEEREELLIQEKSLCEKYAKELSDWTKLAQNLAQQMNKGKQLNQALVRRNQELIRILRDHNILYVSGDDNDDDEEAEEEEEEDFEGEEDDHNNNHNYHRYNNNQ